MVNPLLANAADLERWATSRDAQENLPQLVRRLILSTVDRVLQISFRAQEGVQYGGWDGTVKVEGGNAFVPDGGSAWELSTTVNVTSKANEDYQKRMEDPRGLDPSETAFVFATPRRWTTKKDWISSKEAESVWREVRGHDADDLATWLERSPAVHIWFSSLVGKRPDGVEALSTFWEDWSQATVPPVIARLITAGRDDEIQNVQEWLDRDPTVLALKADSRSEAIAFLVASLENLAESKRLRHLARGVVVRSERAWEWLAVSEVPLLLVPLFEVGDQVVRATHRGHHVLIPLGQGGVASAQAVHLPRLRRDHIRDVLIDMRIDERRVGELAMLARRSLTAFRRKLAVAPEVQCPQWAAPSEAGAIIPAMFAGSWSEASDGDRAILATLAGTQYEEVSRSLTRWANEDDPPVRRIADTWYLASKEDAWPLLSQHITAQGLARFEKVALQVLSILDPSYDLPVGDRWMAGISGHTSAYSGTLREGLADTLALMGARSEATTFIDGSLGQDRADRVIHQLLAQANRDWRLWASLSSVLPLLAEASPDVFLAAFEAGLAGDHPVLLDLFQDRDALGLFAGSSPHSGLLWALECLAWNPQYLSRATLLLATLARLDPGGQLLNRPAGSLREIFLLWLPQTAAELTQRLRVLDLVRERANDVAWQLMCQLLPEPHALSMPTCEPRWREWVPDPQIRPTFGEIWKATAELVERLIVDAGVDVQRWSNLVEQLEDLPDPQREKVIAALLGLNQVELASSDCTLVCEAIRTTIARSKNYPGTYWALSSESIEGLQRTLERLEPADLSAKHGWLFANDAMLGIEGADYSSRDEALTEVQRRAVEEIHSQDGSDGLLDMARRVKEPYLLGIAIGRCESLMDEDDSLLQECLGSDEDVRRHFAVGLVKGRVHTCGLDWAEAKLSGAAASEWSSEQKAGLLACLPFGESTWDLVVREGDEVQHQYWQETPIGYTVDAATCERAAVELTAHGRSHDATHIVAMYVEMGREPLVSTDVVLSVLQGLREVSLERINLANLARDVAQLLNFLDESGQVDQPQMAELEWLFLPLVGEHERRPKTLHSELARDPDFFAEVMRWLYPIDGEEAQQDTDEAQVRARFGRMLLGAWKTVPGTQENGTISGDVLSEWVRAARAAAAQRDQVNVADHLIGRVLAYGSIDSDGTWPCRAVRDVIEGTVSCEMEQAFQTAVYNSRGPYMKSLTEGGAQERQLAERYNRQAERIVDGWPRTAAMLRSIAEYYRRDAHREDARSELDQDLRL
jgi:hypothetical protein